MSWYQRPGVRVLLGVAAVVGGLVVALPVAYTVAQAAHQGF